MFFLKWRNPYGVYLPMLVFALLLLCCGQNKHPDTFNYGTTNDAARAAYFRGFEEILDNGRWTASEAAFREALALDPDWTLAKSLVGRITRDVEERERLYREIQIEKGQVSPDGRLLLDLYLLNLEAANNRDRGIKNTESFNEARRALAERNLGKFSRKYPEDPYAKAEYIEWLHDNHGSQVALDSLRHLASEKQKKLGFYVSYEGSLALELGDWKTALGRAAELKGLMRDSTYTSYRKLRAEIYLEQDSLEKAKHYIDEVVNIDPNHLIALGLQSSINEKLSDE